MVAISITIWMIPCINEGMILTKTDNKYEDLKRVKKTEYVQNKIGAGWIL